MTNEQLKEAIAIEATRRWKERGVHFIETLANIAVELTQEGWTPPKVVDPDLAEAQQIFLNSSLTTPIGMTLTGIKRGRALAAAEAKPGMVWVKHDGTGECPVDPNQRVCVLPPSGEAVAGKAAWAAWKTVTHYAVITPPEDVA